MCRSMNPPSYSYRRETEPKLIEGNHINSERAIIDCNELSGKLHALSYLVCVPNSNLAAILRLCWHLQSSFYISIPRGRHDPVPTPPLSKPAQQFYQPSPAQASPPTTTPTPTPTHPHTPMCARTHIYYHHRKVFE